ncbi:MAG TPA: hypothetical protein VFX58_18710 [Chitinophagaceae bacterium]|nr:hypothetical protein [Chitinophagaceae bacterium]
MKKLLIAFVLLILVLLAAIYILIPGQLLIASSGSFKVNREGAHRFIIDAGNWENWWPGKVVRNPDGQLHFVYKDYDFRISKALYNSLELTMQGKNTRDTAILQMIPHAIDSTGFELETRIASGTNPITRLQKYREATKIKPVFDEILAALQKHVIHVKNIYGIEVKPEKVQFQHLVSTRKTFSNYPGTQEVYAMIEMLRQFARDNGATQLFHPMLNIRQTDELTWIVQVGLPVDREVKSKEGIAIKWMMKDGNILGADVIGGRNTIEDGMKKMERYISDYQRSVIAIPFQSLVTDRLQEPDSSRWVTRLYYPVV